MYRVTLDTRNDLDMWRETARPLLAARIEPHSIIWMGPGDSEGLFGDTPLPDRDGRPVRVPRAFVDGARVAICHSDPRRFDLLYRLAYRLQEDRRLMSVASDADVVHLTKLSKAVRRDSHKMTAFVRFRALDDNGQRFAAWFEPEHYTLERTAPFFAERFAGMEWAIFTPYRSAFWDRKQLSFGAGASRADVPQEDALEDAWRTYFASIFNPARLKISAMTSEMPKKYWRNLPEAELIPNLIRGAQRREQQMIGTAASQPPSRHVRQAERQDGAPAEASPELASLDGLGKAIRSCTRCPLYEQATQAVFGEGPFDAPIMVVGEQPGDKEDLAGRPFVGPAGQLLDDEFAAQRIDRTKLYVTNAVKHFKFVPRGKRRLHQTPGAGEVSACRYWLDHEIRLIRPRVILALGATAAKSLLGPKATISKLRGAPLERDDGTIVFVTVHPSYLLRLPDREKAAGERAAFGRDLAMIRDYMETAIGHPVALDSTPAAP